MVTGAKFVVSVSVNPQTGRTEQQQDPFVVGLVERRILGRNLAV